MRPWTAAFFVFVILAGCQTAPPIARRGRSAPVSTITSAVRTGDGAYHLLLEGTLAGHVRLGAPDLRPILAAGVWPEAAVEPVPIAEPATEPGLPEGGAPLALGDDGEDRPTIRLAGAAVLVRDATGTRLVGYLRAPTCTALSREQPTGHASTSGDGGRAVAEVLGAILIIAIEVAARVLIACLAGCH